MRSIALIWMCLLVTGASAYAQAPKPPEKCEKPDISIVDAFGPKTASDARHFLVRLQDAVRCNDREVVASMIRYPLLISGAKAKLHIKTKSEFLKHYDLIWDQDVRDALLSQSVACLSYASSGFTPDAGSQVGFVIGAHGEIWFTTIDENDTLKIITINN